ncbi:MAG: ribonuclease M5 [Peptococcaceae bacterium]|nr:ribonuclease M5 [Peptococcaceae bacterium]
MPYENDFEELIIVEGKNDAHAVRRALGKVDIIWTEGFGLTEEKLAFITEVAKRKGVIVCTDPDFAGKKIRERINKRVPGAKHVYLSQECARSTKGDDIGLENVSDEEIRKAFSKVLEEKGRSKVNRNNPVILFNMDDMLMYGLVGKEGASEKRSAVGKILGIGDTNAKQFLYRLNRYSFSREDFLAALKEVERKDVD